MAGQEAQPERGPTPALGPLLAQFESRSEADAVGPYELARIFAAWPESSDTVIARMTGREVDPAEAVHELAVVSALARICTGWVGLHIHHALRAGVELRAVARAGVPGADVEVIEAAWRRWADGQLAHGFLERSEYEAIAALFEDGGRS